MAPRKQTTAPKRSKDGRPLRRDFRLTQETWDRLEELRRTQVLPSVSAALRMALDAGLDRANIAKEQHGH